MGVYDIVGTYVVTGDVCKREDIFKKGNICLKKEKVRTVFKVNRLERELFCVCVCLRCG